MNTDSIRYNYSLSLDKIRDAVDLLSELKYDLEDIIDDEDGTLAEKDESDADLVKYEAEDLAWTIDDLVSELDDIGYRIELLEDGIGKLIKLVNA